MTLFFSSFRAEQNNNFVALDVVPFDIPSSWKWVKIKDLCEIINGFTPLRSNKEFWSSKDIPWFTVEDIHNQGRFIYKTQQHISSKALSNKTKRILPPDTVLLCCTASIGEYAYTKISLTTNQQFNGLVIKEDCKSLVNPLFLLEFVKTLKYKLKSQSNTMTFGFLSTEKLGNMEFPLPPIEEQQRIVDKLETILPLMEDI